MIAGQIIIEDTIVQFRMVHSYAGQHYQVTLADPMTGQECDLALGMQNMATMMEMMFHPAGEGHNADKESALRQALHAVPQELMPIP